MSEKTIEELKKTPLYDYYKDQNIKLIDFGGWALPVQFTKIKDEHHAVRNDVGIFDVSHMGEIEVTGEDATHWINTLVTNDLLNLNNGQIQYNTMVNENGGTLDDLLVFKLSATHYWITPNASNKDKILDWMIENNPSNIVEIKDLSDQYGLIAIQGPKSEAVLKNLIEHDLSNLKYYHFVTNQSIGEFDDILISRTGYTGEDGFELYIKSDIVSSIWKLLLQAGENESIVECGLGSRDTLRLEAGMSLYGHELSEEISPLEAGLGFAVKVNKDTEFIGQQALKQQKEMGLKRISRGFDLTGRGIAREGYDVLSQDGEKIGFVTSGTQSPTLGKSIGLMIVEKEKAKFGEEVLIQVRKKQVPAIICKKDWLKRSET